MVASIIAYYVADERTSSSACTYEVCPSNKTFQFHFEYIHPFFYFVAHSLLSSTIFMERSAGVFSFFPLLSYMIPGHTRRLPRNSLTLPFLYISFAASSRNSSLPYPLWQRGRHVALTSLLLLRPRPHQSPRRRRGRSPLDAPAVDPVRPASFPPTPAPVLAGPRAAARDAPRAAAGAGRGPPRAVGGGAREDGEGVVRDVRGHGGGRLEGRAPHGHVVGGARNAAAAAVEGGARGGQAGAP